MCKGFLADHGNFSANGDLLQLFIIFEGFVSDLCNFKLLSFKGHGVLNGYFFDLFVDRTQIRCFAAGGGHRKDLVIRLCLYILKNLSLVNRLGSCRCFGRRNGGLW